MDNLKLGYGGNKTEMKRLIKDAAKMTDVQKKLGVTVDATSMSFGNIVQAINVMQESMYINGTTAKEAKETITGSLNAMKASWGNLLTAIGSGDNLDQCMENMIESVEIFGGNVIPVAERALEGIGIVIEKLAPTIAERLPSLAEKLLPPLLTAAWELTKGLIKALPNIIKSLAGAIVDIFGKQFPIIEKIGNLFKENAGKIANTIKSILPAVLALVGAFKLFKGVKGITSLFGSLKGGAGDGGGIFGVFKTLSETKPTVILKGMLNLAIILGGFTILAAAFTKVAPYIAKMGDLKSILEVATIITVLGVVGYALSQFAGIVGKIKVSTVAKGLANMAIMLGGMSALFVVIGALTFLNFDYKKILKISLILGVLGAVGAACAGFAGIVGMIPIPVVLTGLANIALVLGGLTAVVVAFGALSKIDGFNKFISEGGNTLATLFNVLGKIVGSAIGGLGEGLTNSLPTIGKNLAAFATSLKPMFTMFNGADMSSIGSFFKSLGSFLLQVAGEKVLNFFTGGTNFAKLGQDLNTFATNSKGFFTTVATFPEEGFNKAKMLFNCLAGLKSLPKDGGVVGWFKGDINYQNIANGLKQLSSESVIAFFTAVSSLKQAGFDNATKLFDCLAGLKALPKDGGVVGWFSGNVNYENIAAGLKALSGEGVKNFFAMAGGINPNAFENVTKMFDCLANLKALPKEGGWWDKVTGTETSTISNLATELSNFATKTKGFFDLISTAKTESLTALAQGIAEISQSIADMQTTVQTSAKAILTDFVGMLNSIVTAIDSVDLTTEGSQMINGLISGMNSKKQSAVATARGIANAINAEYRKIQKIHSPSQVYDKYGGYQIQGLINGMESKMPQLKTTVKQTGEVSTPRYTPESTSTTNNRTSYNTFSPSFTLHMNGASATDSNKRKVQRWVQEAIEETFNSMGRTNPSLIEV